MEDWKAKLGDFLANMDLPDGPELLPVEDFDKEVKVAGTLHVVMERKGRNGKTATIVEGFECSDEELRDIAADLKRQLGCGGSARGGEILIQGNCVDKVRAILREKGFKVK